MKINTKLLAGVAASTLALSAVAPLAQAQVDVSASVGVANMYYWRGYDLGNGDAAVSADLSVSSGGAYAGLWTSSGDAALGTEYDIYFGYGGEISGFSYGISYATYVYPSAVEPFVDVNDPEGTVQYRDAAADPFDVAEVIGSLGFGGFEFAYYHGLGDLADVDYWYSTIGYGFDAYSVTFGLHEDDYSHLDLSYAYNDNLSFTLGFVVDDAETGNDEPNFVVSYSLPIE